MTLRKALFELLEDLQDWVFILLRRNEPTIPHHEVLASLGLAPEAEPESDSSTGEHP